VPIAPHATIAKTKSFHVRVSMVALLSAIRLRANH
jgi:hypothetical protein